MFCHENGAPYTSDQLNWRFSKMTRRAGIGRWHAHEGRHTAVSIMSSNGVPIQDISDTVGHKSTHVTETVYRHVIVPEIRGGATVMDDVFMTTKTTQTRATEKPRPLRLLIWDLIFERRRDKSVELRGFEPLTFCMPCSRVSSDSVALGPVTALQSSFDVWGRLARSGGIWGRWSLVWSWFAGPPGRSAAPRRVTVLRCAGPSKAYGCRLGVV